MKILKYLEIKIKINQINQMDIAFNTPYKDNQHLFNSKHIELRDL